MDFILDAADRNIFTPYVYPVTWPECDPWRQVASLLVIVNTFSFSLYFLLATTFYFLIFDHRLMAHPQVLQNQVRKEITCTIYSLSVMSVPTVGMFFLEVRGYSKLYDNVGDTWLGYVGLFISFISFTGFTDMCIYWIHRFLHHKWIYKSLHKRHHKWKVPTPFASHAVHPLDGFLLSLPYHIYPFIFPLHKMTYLGLFTFINVWTVTLHDGDLRMHVRLRPYVNGSAHHMDHHMHHNCNYGQFFTLWDKIGQSFKSPTSFEGCGPLDLVLSTAKMMEGDKEEMKTEVNKFTNGNAKKVE